MPALHTGSNPAAFHHYQRDTLHTECGRGAAVYSPDLDAEFPWASYWKGIPGARFQTSERVATHFRTVRSASLKVAGE